MTPEQLPNIANDKGIREEAELYASSIFKRLRATDIQIALKEAYLRGCASGFSYGWKICQNRQK